MEGLGPSTCINKGMGGLETAKKRGVELRKKREQGSRCKTVKRQLQVKGKHSTKETGAGGDRWCAKNGHTPE